MDISEEQRAAHKREFLEFLDQDVRLSITSLSDSTFLSFLCNNFMTVMIIRWGKAYTWTR